MNGRTWILGVIAMLASAGIIGSIVQYARFGAHEASSDRIHEAFTEGMGEIKSDLNSLDDQADIMRDRSIRQEMLLESIARTVDAPVPPHSDTPR